MSSLKALPWESTDQRAVSILQVPRGPAEQIDSCLATLEAEACALAELSGPEQHPNIVGALGHISHLLPLDMLQCDICSWGPAR